MKTLRAAGLSLVAAMAAAAMPPSANFAPTGSLAIARFSHTASRLPDGRVLVCGGYINGTANVTATAEIYTPATGAWTAAPNMSVARIYHSATALADGRILIAGGSAGGGYDPLTCEIFDPATNAFSPTGSLSSRHSGHGAIRLADGRVLVCGGVVSDGSGSDTDAAHVYNPATGAWSPTGSLLTPRTGPAMALLPDGRVLVMGGTRGANGGWATLASCEYYDPVSGFFSPAPPLGSPRNSFGAVTLPDGRILAAGGGNGAGPVATAEVFNPTSLTWSATGTMSSPRSAHTVTLLPDGRVLVAGGTYVAGADVYDPLSGTFSSIGDMSAARSNAAATLLADGRVLIAGGQSAAGDLASCELYCAVPPGLVSIEVTPAHPSIPVGATQPFTATGTFSDGSTRTLGAAGWTPRAPMPIARAAFGAALGGRLYAIGGYNASYNGTNENQEYDSATDTWTARAPIPTGRSSHTVTALNGRIHVLGGSPLANTVTGSHQVYDPASDLWSTFPPMPTARGQHGAAVLLGKLHAFGGTTGLPTTAHEAFDPATNAWSTRAPLPSVRSAAAWAVVNGILYVIGGEDGYVRLASVLAYNPMTDTWIPRAPLPEARHFGRAEAVNGRIYVFGGGTGSAPSGSSVVHVYDPCADTWTTGPSLAVTRNPGASGVIDGRLHLAGGSAPTTGGQLADHVALDPSGVAWSGSTGAASIDANGVATGLAPGTATIAATSGTVAGSTSLTVFNPNSPPVAHAGPDQTVECTGPAGASVTLDGTGSSDPDGDTLTYAWTGAFGTATGANPTLTLPLGVHTITLTVSDGEFTASDDVVILVQDTTAPSIASVSATPNTLWPPNHSYRDVAVSVSASDFCDPSPLSQIISVTSSESEGENAPDWIITGDLTLKLRSERNGPADRVYTITVRCTDDSGNSATATVIVTCPNSQGN